MSAKPSRRPRCWSCDKAAPGVRLASYGWFVRRMKGQPMREIVCPECLADYGVPDPVPYTYTGDDEPDPTPEGEPRRVYHLHTPPGWTA